jgi:hypothetical protein
VSVSCVLDSNTVKISNFDTLLSTLEIVLKADNQNPMPVPDDSIVFQYFVSEEAYYLAGSVKAFPLYVNN